MNCHITAVILSLSSIIKVLYYVFFFRVLIFKYWKTEISLVLFIEKMTKKIKKGKKAHSHCTKPWRDKPLVWLPNLQFLTKEQKKNLKYCPLKIQKCYHPNLLFARFNLNSTNLLLSMLSMGKKLTQDDC